MLKFNKGKKFVFRRYLIAIILCGIILYLIIHYYPKVTAKNTDLHTNLNEVKSKVEEPISEVSVDTIKPNATTSSAIETDKNKKALPIIPNTNATFNENFFNNAVFIGDSVTEAIEGYAMLQDAKVVATNGQTLVGASTLAGKVKDANPKKIFILLGTNDLLNNITTEEFVSYYENLIKLFLNDSPNAKIYIQSLLPVEKSVDSEKPLLSNSRIDEFNKALKDMNKDANVKFVNIASVFKNENGSMYDGYTSDGIHLNYNHYNMWFSYLENNAK